MRKVIPYIASQFRKDKIWLRRTKPSKRQYQVMVAVDDSSSMADNHSKQLAFESLATIANALTLLEVGELAICRLVNSLLYNIITESQLDCIDKVKHESKICISILLKNESKICISILLKYEDISHYKYYKNGNLLNQFIFNL